MKYRKRPLEIEAIQYTGSNALELIIWSKGKVEQCKTMPELLIVLSLEGRMWLNPGSWLICGIEGEFYPCDPAIFEKTYEPC